MTQKKKWIFSILTLLVAFVFFFPLYWMAITSLKPDIEILSTTQTYYPHQVTFEPWLRQFMDADFLSSLRNSVVIALLSMSISLVLGIPAAYAMGRYHVPFAKVFMLCFLVTQMLPASVLLTPLYLTFSRWGLLNTYFAPAFAVASHSIPFIIVTLRPYFVSVPAALDDAARIDGCGAIRSFVYVMIPTIKAGIITVMAITFLHGWNDLVYSMTFNVQANMRPLTANIHKFMDAYGTKWNYIMAYGMILVLPVILLFVFLQKYIVGGMTAGAVKE